MGHQTGKSGKYKTAGHITEAGRCKYGRPFRYLISCLYKRKNVLELVNGFL